MPCISLVKEERWVNSFDEIATSAGRPLPPTSPLLFACGCLVLSDQLVLWWTICETTDNYECTSYGWPVHHRTHTSSRDLISSTSVKLVYGNSFLVTFLSLSAHKLLLRPRLDIKYLSSWTTVALVVLSTGKHYVLRTVCRYSLCTVQCYDLLHAFFRIIDMSGSGFRTGSFNSKEDPTCS